MNIKLILLLLSIVVLNNISAFEMDRKGNGGDIIFCDDKSNKHHLTLLDFYEARRLNRVLNLGDGNNWKKLVENVLDRWEKVAKRRSENYKKWLDSFEKEALIADNFLGDIPDHGNVVLPRGCELRQVAIQRPDSILFEEVPRYEIDLEYWKQMSEVEKAGLVLHELVLREAINNAYQSNSIPTRYFVGYLSSEEPEVLHYFKTIVNIGFPYAELGYGLLLKTGERICDEWGSCNGWSRITLNSSGYPSQATILEYIADINLPFFSCEIKRVGEAGNAHISFREYAEGIHQNISIRRGQRGFSNSCLRESRVVKIKHEKGGKIWSLKLGGQEQWIDIEKMIPESTRAHYILEFTSNNAKVTLDSRESIFFGDIPGVGFVPTSFHSDRDNYHLEFGESSFFQSLNKLFENPKGYGKCASYLDTEYIKDSNNKYWRYSLKNGVEEWVEEEIKRCAF